MEQEEGTEQADIADAPIDMLDGLPYTLEVPPPFKIASRMGQDLIFTQTGELPGDPVASQGSLRRNTIVGAALDQGTALGRR